MNRLLVLIVLLGATTTACAHPGYDAIDRQVGSLVLRTRPAIPPGELVMDGSNECATVPFDICDYQKGDITYSFLEGELVRKDFVFANIGIKGPLGLSKGDGQADVIRAVSAYSKDLKPVVWDEETIFYVYKYKSFDCRMEFKFKNKELESMFISVAGHYI